MDHFALPEDELGRARRGADAAPQLHGLHRAVGARHGRGRRLGASATSRALFVQNTKKLTEYYEALDAGRFPIERGYVLDEDDALRRHVITELMCNGHLDVREVERRFGITFAEYFAPELAELTAPGVAGRPTAWCEVDAEALDVTPVGRMFVRNVCMVFDRYLRARTGGATPVFSRTV